MKIKGNLMILSLWLIAATGVHAQTPKESFQEFRKGLHKDFNDFRSKIKEQYADFLAGEWHPYESLKGEERYSSPKPQKAPVKDNSRNPVKDVSRDSKKVPETKYSAKPTPYEHSCPEPPQVDLSSGLDNVEFYGMTVAVPKIDFNILQNIGASAQTPAQWKKLQEGSAAQAGEAIKRVGDDMGLNGYLMFRLAQSYVNSKFPSATPLSRLSVVHYLLVCMGYDARLAISELGDPLLLLPFAQKVYSSVYIPLDGAEYTVYGADMDVIPNISGVKVYTCSLPSGLEKGEKMDLRINGLNLPYSPIPFSFSGNGITLSGEVNENLFRMLYRYPQMPTEDFASSVLDKQLRDRLIESLRSQIGVSGRVEAVNKLLGFFHEGFEYATDEQRHGFEKPYFLEETLYYDKCDCEDRAIMFTWLLWNALGVESQLIAYPMHESAAVNIPDEIKGGYSYTYQGERFWSADPTYIGSKVGDVMPQFSRVSPKIDKTYRGK